MMRLVFIHTVKRIKDIMYEFDFTFIKNIYNLELIKIAFI
jgi:hypothetical protein